MRILRVVLTGYKPLLLNDIEELTVDFTSDFTLVIGSNGSGKSALLKAATPLPAPRSAYATGGSAVVTVEHNNHTYVATSILKGKATYSLTKDGVELNGSGNGTAKVQTELVEREFNYSTLIHQILTGTLTFTQMNTTQRRELLVRVSPLDLKYAEDLWIKVRGELRDTTGAIKHLQSRQAEAHAELKTVDTIDDILQKQPKLEALQQRLLPWRPTAQASTVERIVGSIEQLQRQLSSMMSCTAIHLRNPESTVNNPDDLTILQGRLQQELDDTCKGINEIISQQADIDELVHALSDGLVSPDEIQRGITDLQKELPTIPTITLSDTPVTTLQQLEQARYAIENISTDPMEYIPTVDIQTATTVRIAQQVQVDRHTFELQSLEDRLVQLQAEPGIECGNCKTMVYRSGTGGQAVINKITARITASTDALVLEQETLQNCKDLCYTHEQYTHVSTLVNQVRMRYPALLSLWTNGPSVVSTIRDPGGWISAALHYQRRVESTALHQEKSKSLTELQETLTRHQRLVELQRFQDPDIHLDALTLLRTQLSARIKNITEFKKAYQGSQRKLEQVDAILDEINSLFRQLTDAEIGAQATARVTRLYDTLAGYRNIIHKHSALTDRLQVLDADLANTQLQAVDLKLLLDTLSPADGLIAEQLLGFMNQFIGSVNLISDQVWGYPLHVVPLTEVSKLDYKFPLTVDGTTVEELTLASEGQQDVINLAFTMVIRQYLGLQDYPIYLDEPGASFDTHHRTRLMDYIRSLQTNQQCSQILMVSHYSANHGGLVHHDTVVLHGDHVSVPSQYNTTVKIRRRENV